MFWKKHTEPVPVVVSPTEVEPQAKPQTVEEAARQWFKEKTGQTMPEEFKTWLRRLAHDEAVRVTTQTSILGRGEMMKLHEARRLAATKLENVERSIETVRRKLDWTERYTELGIRLGESHTAVYEAGKQAASIRDARLELERYDTFEPIEDLYRKYQTVNAQMQEVRAHAAVLQRRREEAEAKVAQAQNAVTQADKQYEDAENQMHTQMDTLAEGFKLDGVQESLAWSAATVGEWHKAAQTSLATLRRGQAALQAEADSLEADRGTTRSRLQSMEMHAPLFKAGGAVMVKLDRLYEIDNKREELRRKAEQTAARQRDLDDRLSRLFEQDQALVASLSTLQGEVQMHREANRGQDGTRLQARTMELRQRRQQLLTAQQLWARICALSADIDERRQADARQMMHLEHDEKTIDKLACEVRSMRQAAEQRRYAYTVSKSQNVIKLRADLREGTACSVCGALNHPYHSDTMTEQNRLMGEWKTEAEMLDVELRGKEQQLDTMRMKHAAEQGAQAAEQEFVRVLQEEYRSLVRDWAQYADLAPGFADCNPQVGGMARQAMIGQLLENTDKQATEAQQELDTYNYHQLAINRAAEQIDDKENKRADLASALNETNTGCQVMAGGVERIQKRIAKLTASYTTLFEELGRIITLPDWANNWRAGHENFKLELRRRMDEYEALQQAAAEQGRRLDVIYGKMEVMAQSIAQQEARVLELQHQLERTATRDKEASNTYARLLGEERAADAFSRTRRQLETTGAERNTLHEALRTACEQRDTLAGQADEAAHSVARLEAEVSEMHSQIDEWIRNFNSTHPPVQYAELDRLLRAGRDWSSQRQQVGEVMMRHTLAMARDEDLRSALLALQADDNRAMDSKGETIETLITQRENLERRRQEIMYEMATIDQRLDAHDKALKQLEAMEQ